MESAIEVRYMRGGVEVGSPITVNQISAHPDITDLDLTDYINWAKDAFSIGVDIYDEKWDGLVKDIGSAISHVFVGKNKSNQSTGKLILLGPGTVPGGGPAVDQAILTFRAWSEDDLTASFGRIDPEGKIIGLSERRYDSGGQHFYEKSYRIPLHDTGPGPYFFTFGSGDDGEFFDVGVASFLTLGIAQSRHSGFLIQSTSGSPGNLELVVPGTGGGLSYYWREYLDSGWNGPFPFGRDLGVVDSVSLIQGNFGLPEQPNLELVARVGQGLFHFWHVPGGPPDNWGPPTPVTLGGVSGNPALLQSTYGIKGHFELVAPRVGGGLSYFRRDNDPDANLTWHGPFDFATDVGPVDSVCLLQSNYGPPGAGQLEAVAQIGNGLAQFIRTNDDPPYHWSGPNFFADGVSGRPSLVQGWFGSRGNYELVVPRIGNTLSHYWRNNDPGQNQTWNGPFDIATGLGPVNAVSLVQSNSGSGPGYLDVVTEIVGRLAHFSRIDIPDWRWSGPHFFDSKLTVSVEPYPVPTAQLVTITVRAKDRFTNQLVDGAVMVNDNRTGTHPPIMIGRTNTPIRHTFTPKTVRIFDPESRTWTTETTYPTGFVRAAGYVDMDIDWGFPEG